MNNDKHHGNKFLDGFLLGLLVGGVAVFLFGTKKGKGLLKIISEQGMDGLVSLLEEYDLAEIEEEDGEEKSKSNGHARKEVFSKEEDEPQVENESEEEVAKEAPKKKRFFKRR